MSAAIAEAVSAVSVNQLALAAKRAGRRLASLSPQQKNQILLQIAESLERRAADVLTATAEDAAAASKLVDRGELSRALYQRLLLSPGKYQGMIDGYCRQRNLRG
jgi:glutamate-5-semialdehyde dehydrogenase